MNHIFNYIMCMAWCVHCLGRDGTRMHHGMKASWQRQRDTMSNVLLWYLGSWHSCRCCRSRTPLHGNNISWCHWPFSRIMHPVTQQKLFMNGFRNMRKTSRCSPDLNFNWASVGCAGKTSLIHGASTCNLQDLLLTSWCQTMDDTFRLMESIHWQARYVLVAQGWPT